jgi:hypothetical protein
MLTQLTTVKARLGIQTEDVKDDVLLTNFIVGVSARFENDCNRTFGFVLTATDEFQGDETELRLKYYPVASITQFDLKETEAEGWVLQDPSQFDYVIRRNHIVSLDERLGEWKHVLRVTYSGGFILPDGTSPAPPGGITPPNLPDDLQMACVEQVAYLYQNKSRLGLLAVSGEGGSISQFATLDLLPGVKAVVAKYERWMS